MRTSLDHLPPAKQRELAHVVRVLFDEFERVRELATQPWKKRGRILKVILYGSYARGDWVDDKVGGYISDYDNSSSSTTRGSPTPSNTGARPTTG